MYSQEDERFGVGSDRSAIVLDVKALLGTAAVEHSSIIASDG